MEQKFYITGLGNAIIDILAFVDDEFLTKNSIEKGAMNLINEKSAALFSSLEYEKICPGGSTANTIVNLSNFKINNAFIGNVGSGTYGYIFHQDLEDNNVNFCCNSKSAFGKTARSFVLITPDAQRTMCTYLGEASEVSQNIDHGVIKNSDILYIEGYLWDKPKIINSLRKAINVAKENKTKIAFTLSDSFWVQNHHQDFVELASLVDIIFANEEEVKMLTHCDTINKDNIIKLAKNNKKLVLVITRGEKGVIIFDAKTQNFLKVPSLGIKNVIDSTGAGDAFASGFLYGLYHNMSYEQSANTGHLFASRIIQKVGARFEKEDILYINQNLNFKSVNVG